MAFKEKEKLNIQQQKNYLHAVCLVNMHITESWRVQNSHILGILWLTIAGWLQIAG